MSFLTSRQSDAPHGIGKSIPRREDARLLTGAGQYASDFSLPGQLHAYLARSPHAHAKIVKINVAQAIGEPGVIAVLTEGDAAAEGLKPIPHSPVHAALLLDALATELKRRADAAVLELVTSGPDIAGTTRDTGVVLRELFAEAEHRVLVVGFAVHQGREIFAALADRMQQRAELIVRLCLDVQRSPGDTTRSDALLRRFAERFVRQEWPGPRMPALFYDPRSLATGEGPRASLHAKCVVVDGVRALIGSANLTEAAQQRNIEIGVGVNGAIVETIEWHFEALISGGYLQPLTLEI